MINFVDDQIPTETFKSIWYPTAKVPRINELLNGPNGLSQINADFYNLRDLNLERPDLNLVGITAVFLVVLVFVITKIGKHINSKFVLSHSSLGNGYDPKEFLRLSFKSEKSNKSDLGLKYTMSDEEAPKTRIIHYKPTPLNSSFMQ